MDFSEPYIPNITTADENDVEELEEPQYEQQSQEQNAASSIIDESLNLAQQMSSTEFDGRQEESDDEDYEQNDDEEQDEDESGDELYSPSPSSRPTTKAKKSKSDKANNNFRLPDVPVTPIDLANNHSITYRCRRGGVWRFVRAMPITPQLQEEIRMQHSVYAYVGKKPSNLRCIRYPKTRCQYKMLLQRPGDGRPGEEQEQLNWLRGQHNIPEGMALLWERNEHNHGHVEQPRGTEKSLKRLNSTWHVDLDWRCIGRDWTLKKLKECAKRRGLVKMSSQYHCSFAAVDGHKCGFRMRRVKNPAEEDRYTVYESGKHDHGMGVEEEDEDEEEEVEESEAGTEREKIGQENEEDGIEAGKELRENRDNDKNLNEEHLSQSSAEFDAGILDIDTSNQLINMGFEESDDDHEMGNDKDNQEDSALLQSIDIEAVYTKIRHSQRIYLHKLRIASRKRNVSRILGKTLDSMETTDNTTQENVMATDDQSSNESEMQEELANGLQNDPSTSQAEDVSNENQAAGDNNEALGENNKELEEETGETAQVGAEEERQSIGNTNNKWKKIGCWSRSNLCWEVDKRGLELYGKRGIQQYYYKCKMNPQGCGYKMRATKVENNGGGESKYNVHKLGHHSEHGIVENPHPKRVSAKSTYVEALRRRFRKEEAGLCHQGRQPGEHLWLTIGESWSAEEVYSRAEEHGTELRYWHGVEKLYFKCHKKDARGRECAFRLRAFKNVEKNNEGDGEIRQDSSEEGMQGSYTVSETNLWHNHELESAADLMQLRKIRPNRIPGIHLIDWEFLGTVDTMEDLQRIRREHCGGKLQIISLDEITQYCTLSCWWNRLQSNPEDRLKCPYKLLFYREFDDSPLRVYEKGPHLHQQPARIIYQYSNLEENRSGNDDDEGTMEGMDEADITSMPLLDRENYESANEMDEANAPMPILKKRNRKAERGSMKRIRKNSKTARKRQNLKSTTTYLKQPMNGFMFFVMQNRRRYTEPSTENYKDSREQNKELGRQWRGMNLEARRPYLELERKARQEYARKRKQWQEMEEEKRNDRTEGMKKKKHQENNNKLLANMPRKRIQVDSNGMGAQKRRQDERNRNRQKQSGNIKKSSWNAFTFFMAENRCQTEKLTENCKDAVEQNKQMDKQWWSKEIGRRWREMDSEARKPYLEMVRKAREERKREKNINKEQKRKRYGGRGLFVETRSTRKRELKEAFMVGGKRKRKGAYLDNSSDEEEEVAEDGLIRAKEVDRLMRRGEMNLDRMMEGLTLTETEQQVQLDDGDERRDDNGGEEEVEDEGGDEDEEVEDEGEINVVESDVEEEDEEEEVDEENEEDELEEEIDEESEEEDQAGTSESNSDQRVPRNDDNFMIKFYNRFLSLMEEDSQKGQQIHSVQGIAQKLGPYKAGQGGVVRYIYNIVQVMEGLGAMSRINQTNYRWNGLEHLPKLLNRLQSDSQNVSRHIDKVSMKLRTSYEPRRKRQSQICFNLAIFDSICDDGLVKSSMAELCRQFLMILLCANNRRINLDVARTMLGLNSGSSRCSKSRRLCDILKVLVGMNWIVKNQDMLGTRSVQIIEYCGPEPDGHVHLSHHTDQELTNGINNDSESLGVEELHGCSTSTRDYETGKRIENDSITGRQDDDDDDEESSDTIGDVDQQQNEPEITLEGMQNGDDEHVEANDRNDDDNDELYPDQLDDEAENDDDDDEDQAGISQIRASKSNIDQRGTTTSNDDSPTAKLYNRFLNRMEEDSQKGQKIHTMQSIAQKLGAYKAGQKERDKNIYNIIQVMEALDAMSRMKKKKYRWNGLEHLPKLLNQLQRDSQNVSRHIDKVSKHKSGQLYPNLAIFDSIDDGIIRSSMAELCRQFLLILLCSKNRRICLDVAYTVLGHDSDSRRSGSKSRRNRINDILRVLIGMQFVSKKETLFGTKAVQMIEYCGPEPDAISDSGHVQLPKRGTITDSESMNVGELTGCSTSTRDYESGKRNGDDPIDRRWDGDDEQSSDTIDNIDQQQGEPEIRLEGMHNENDEHEEASHDDELYSTQMDFCEDEEANDEDQTGTSQVLGAKESNTNQGDATPSNDDNSMVKLCSRFLNRMEEDSQKSQKLYTVQDIAQNLSAHNKADQQGVKRHIYNIVQVMEALGAMSRITLTNYRWNGLEHLPKLLNQLQRNSKNVSRHIDIVAKQMNTLNESSRHKSSQVYPNLAFFGSINDGLTSSVADLCRQFLIILLSAKNRRITLDVASTVLGRNSASNQSWSKSRRLCDILKVLVGLNFITKKQDMLGTTKVQMIEYCGPEPEGHVQMQNEDGEHEDVGLNDDEEELYPDQQDFGEEGDGNADDRLLIGGEEIVDGRNGETNEEDEHLLMPLMEEEDRKEDVEEILRMAGMGTSPQIEVEEFDERRVIGELEDQGTSSQMLVKEENDEEEEDTTNTGRDIVDDEFDQPDDRSIMETSDTSGKGTKRKDNNTSQERPSKQRRIDEWLVREDDQMRPKRMFATKSSRPRGRPRKERQETEDERTPKTPRPRGRPRKERQEMEDERTPKTPRPRGRPRKERAEERLTESRTENGGIEIEAVVDHSSSQSSNGGTSNSQMPTSTTRRITHHEVTNASIGRDGSTPPASSSSLSVSVLSEPFNSSSHSPESLLQQLGFRPLAIQPSFFNLADPKTMEELRKIAAKRGLELMEKSESVLFLPTRGSRHHAQGLVLALSHRSDHIRIDEFHGGCLLNEAAERWPRNTEAQTLFLQHLAKKVARIFE